MSRRILFIALAIGVSLWLLDGIDDYFLSSLDPLSPAAALLWGGSFFAGVPRVVTLLLCLGVGLWLSRLLASQEKQQKDLEMTVSREREARQNAEHERALLDAFMDNSVDYIYFKDRDSRFLRVNKAWANTWGGPFRDDPNQLIGKSDFDFFSPDSAQDKFKDEQEIIRTGQPLYGKEEHDAPMGKGEKGWVSTIKMPLKDREGNTIGTFGVSRDITDLRRTQEALERYKKHLEELVKERTAQLEESNRELERDIVQRQQAEERLRQSEENLATTLNSLGEGVIATDAQGHVSRMNSMAERLLNTLSSNAEGKPLDEVFRLIDKKTRRPVAHVLGRGEGGSAVSAAFAGGVKLLRQDGRECSVEYSSTPIRTPDGRELGAVVVFRDVTEQRRLEKQLRQSERMQAIGQLAGGVAHDFNNQITGIMGCAEMLKILVTEKEPRHYVNMIMTSAGRASDLTAKLLAFSRQGTFQSIPVDVHKVIAEIVSLLERTIDKRIKLKQELLANPPFIIGDPTQIQNALLNIALNARDALPEGGDLVFATRVVDIDQKFISSTTADLVPGRYLEVGVTDTGIGMSEETQSHLFEPFFTTKKKGKGNGMGLAAVYGTVKGHKGGVTVQSQPGKGSTFRLYLPLAEGVDLSKPAVQAVAPERGSASVLVVDDEEVVRNVASDMLKSLGYRVQTCQGGREAVDYYREHWRQIDLVLLDVVMPDLSGRDTYLALFEINPAIRVIIASGYSFSRGVQEMIDKGAVSFLQKPFLLNELARKVSDALSWGSVHPS